MTQMKDHKPVYVLSLNDAIEYGEIENWRNSHKENCACARAIEQCISEHYRDNRLEDCTEELIDRYGFDRVNYVLANTVQRSENDGRFSPENKKWARTIRIPVDDNRWHFAVDSHPGLTDLFISQMRKAWQQLGLIGENECLSEKDGEIDYKNKVLVLDPKILKESYRTPDNQLFFAISGFGCAPNSRGRKVFGRFLNNGEETHFYRGDFIGVIKDECLPEWAAEKISQEPTCQKDGQQFGGM